MQLSSSVFPFGGVGDVKRVIPGPAGTHQSLYAAAEHGLEFVIGEDVVYFYVRSGHLPYVLVLSLDASGRLAVVFPTPEGEDPLIAGRLRSAGSIQCKPPGGLDAVIALASNVPWLGELKEYGVTWNSLLSVPTYDYRGESDELPLGDLYPL